MPLRRRAKRRPGCSPLLANRWRSWDGYQILLPPSHSLFPPFRLADLRLPSDARARSIPLAQRPPKPLGRPSQVSAIVPASPGEHRRTPLTQHSLFYLPKNQRHAPGNNRFPGFPLLP